MSAQAQAVASSGVTPSTVTSNVSTQEMLDNLIAMINTIIQALEKVQQANFNQQQKQATMQQTNSVLGKDAAEKQIEKIKEWEEAQAEAQKWGIFAKLFEALAVFALVVFSAVTFGAGTAIAVGGAAILMTVLENVPATQDAINSVPDKICDTGIGKDISEAIFKVGLTTLLTCGAGTMATTVDVAAETAAAETISTVAENAGSATAEAAVTSAETAGTAAAEDSGTAAAKAAGENAEKFNASSKSFAQRATFATTFTGLNPLQNVANIVLKASGKEDDDEAKFISTLIVTLTNLLISLVALAGAGGSGTASSLLTKAGASDGLYQGLAWGNRFVQAGTTATQVGSGYATIQIGEAQNALSLVQALMALCQGRQAMSEKTMAMLQTALNNAVKTMGQVLENTSSFSLMTTAEANVMLGRSA